MSVALGGVVGDTIATVNRSLTQASQTHDARLAALDVAQAALAVYGAPAAAAGGKAPALVKVTVSVGGGTSHSDSQASAVANDGSTLTAGANVTIDATGSGAKDADGNAVDGDITARGTQISGENVTLQAARDVNLLAAQDTTQQTGSNSSTNASIGVGFGLGGSQNGFTLELAASGSKGNVNGNSVTNQNTEVSAADTLSITSGRDTNLIGAVASGNTVDADVGRNLTVTSPQDTNTYNSQQDSAGFQASICVPPFCYGQTVSASGSASDQTIRDNYQSVGQQSGIEAGNGGFDINVGNHTQLDGGVIASTAAAENNSLSTQTFGYTNLQNTADYSGSSVGFSASTAGMGMPGVTSVTGMGPTGFGVAGTSGSASGTTYAAVSPGTITVRGDAGTGQDSTAGLSRDTANANGSVANTFNAQDVQNDMAVQQGAVQVGMQVAGDVADELARSDPSTWGPDGAGRIALHAGVAAAGAALGGGNIAGAVAGTVAGDLAAGAVGNALGNTAGASLVTNVVAGAAGAAAGAALGGAGGALSGANGALGADLYNRQYHPDEKKKLAELQEGQTPEEQQQLADAACYLVQCAAQLSTNDPDYATVLASQQRGAGYITEQNDLKATGLFVYSPYDALNDPLAAMGDWGVQQVESAGRGAANMGNQLVGIIKANSGQTPPSDPNNELLGENDGNPPNTGASPVTPAVPACDPPVCTMIPGSPGTAGYVPGNAIFNSDSTGNTSSSNSAEGGTPTQASSKIVSDLGAQGVSTSYPTPMTKNSATQIVLDMPQQEAIANLQANGYATSYGGNGAVTMLTKDGVTYTFYGASTGNGIAGSPKGVPSASVTVMGQATKLRFSSK
ncbi:hemagglutinin repeat-containing protein [Paraburkholderia antibiotica]|uniref:Filamentous hemagglutinin n=1 Tax=Paraburkholderia antibiotica TaxID=2728839 RepID=A0A7Y0A309_9BURK|nr:hemagglutinin repeat-containing protein [Paraburkholderia antibiotica]NML35489.1 hypothetical protein [Paraburkholderia antibiotica]